MQDGANSTLTAHPGAHHRANATSRSLDSMPRIGKKAQPAAHPLRTMARSSLGGHALGHSTARTANVTGRDLQTAVLLVLTLYGSLGLLNVKNELSGLLHGWQSVIEFLAQMLF